MFSPSKRQRLQACRTALPLALRSCPAATLSTSNERIRERGSDPASGSNPDRHVVRGQRSLDEGESIALQVLVSLDNRIP